MRRAVPVLIACLLFGATACGTARTGDQAATQPPVPPAASVPAGAGKAPATPGVAPAALAETKQVCEAIGQVYTDNMGRFAGSLSSLVADRADAAKARTSQERAQKALGTFATDVRTATQYSPAAARAAGKQAADRLGKAAGDDAYFAKIKTTKDVDRVLGTDLTKWLAPITEHCS
jgi:hypothetical protein